MSILTAKDGILAEKFSLVEKELYLSIRKLPRTSLYIFLPRVVAFKFGHFCQETKFKIMKTKKLNL